MSKNYIKVLLDPFRESKVLGSLLKWLEPAASDGSRVHRGGKDEVKYNFFVIKLVIPLRLYDWYLLVIRRSRRAGKVQRNTAQACGG